MKRTRHLRDILFWSIISAAFIGPGTVATAARAGAEFGATLIWALVFSTLATIVLQEMASRLTIETGKSLGEHLRERFQQRLWIPVAIWGVVAFGCAAYEAGNILGAIAGVSMAIEVPSWLVTVLITAFAFVLMAQGKVRLIGRVLGCIVAVMGVAFVSVALGADLDVSAMLRGAFVPRIPDGSLFLIIALVGTTIVPYNLFLGSGISKGQSLRTMRAALPLAIAIGGLISMSILLCGTLISGEMQFETLAAVLEERMGVWAKYLVGIGLFAAGMTSAITAPLAAAVTARGIFPSWRSGTVQFKAVWGTVLLTGFVLSMLKLQPIPVIIAAQALNGVLLPVVAIVLYDICIQAFHRRMARWHIILALTVVCIVTFLGCNSLLAALGRIGVVLSDDIRATLAGALAVLTAFCLVLRTRRKYQHFSVPLPPDL